MIIFNRICIVTIKRTVQTATEARFFVTQPNVVEIRDLRVEFTVKKSHGKTPNTCEVKITNLAPHTRAEVELPGIVVTLAAGHDGVARHLFTGDARIAYSELDGGDWVTTLHLADGGKAFGHARATASFRGGTPVITVLRAAAKAMHLELPRAVEEDPTLRTQFTGGYALEGPVRDKLTAILAPFGYGWSIQDGRLQLLRDNDITPGTSREISEGNGMIGSPKFDTPTKKAKRKLSVDSVLYPELTPGGAITVSSRSINGSFRIDEVVHKGDTFGTSESDWTTSVEAR